jgi:hypothetical protein
MTEINKLLKNKFGVSRIKKEFVRESQSPVDKIVKKTISKEPVKKLSEAEQYKKELSMIQKKAGMIKAAEDELYRIEEDREHKKKVDFVNKTLASPFTGNKEVDMKPSLDYAIEELLPKAKIPEVIEYPEAFLEEPALNRELAEFKRKINEHLHKVGFSNPGGGGIGGISDAVDIDTGTAKINGKFLKYDASQSKWVGDDAGAAAVFKTISISGQDDVVADASTDTLTIAASSGISVTTTAVSDTITFGIDIDSATDGTSITIADTDKILIDDSGTTKYVNASQVETYINPKGKAIAMAIVFG